MARNKKFIPPAVAAKNTAAQDSLTTTITVTIVGAVIAAIIAAIYLSPSRRPCTGEESCALQAELASVMTDGKLGRLLIRMDNFSNASVLEEPGLLDQWPAAARQQLLRLSIEVKSQPTMRLALAQGVCAAARDDDVKALFTESMRFCASRSMRFRLQDLIIGKHSGDPDSHPVAVLREGDAAAAFGLRRELERRLPILQSKYEGDSGRGTTMLYRELAQAVQAVPDEALPMLRDARHAHDRMPASPLRLFVSRLLPGVLGALAFRVLGRSSITPCSTT